MRVTSLLLAVLVTVACNGLFAQQANYNRKAHPALTSGSNAMVALPSGYFNVKLKATSLPATQWVKQQRSSLGFDARTELRAGRTARAIDGRTYLRFRQYRDGAPVLGADLIVQTNRRGNPQQLSGFLAPNELFPAQATGATSPLSPVTVPDDELELTARQFLVSRYPHAQQWNIIDHGDSWTATNPWQPTPTSPFRKCRTLEVQEPAGPLAEMVYVDLQTGKVVFSHPLHCSLNRRLHHSNVATANIVWREGDAFPGMLYTDDQEIIRATEETYSLYYRSFGRQGHDGNGSLMRAVNHANVSGCPNARARNYTIYTCTGVVGDDIIGHEWTHNYTSSMNDLLSTYESGALQEALADIFGESIDLLNDRGLDDNDQQVRNGCFSDNYRWSIAEDAVAIDTILRDLWAPNCKTDPERRYSSLYPCITPSGTDVHSQSTIVSRSFALLVDGDTTLTPAVRGIGLTKALHIFYHANANYVTRVTDFAAFAMMLRQSAEDLRGVNLPQLTLINTPAPFSNDSVTAADLLSLDAAITITQLDLPSQCPGAPTLLPDTPDLCAEAADAFVTIYAEDWEEEPQGWTITQHPVVPEDWEDKPWELTTIPLPEGRPGRAVFAPNPHTGNCISNIQSGAVSLTSPPITLPANFTNYQLQFSHYYSIEPESDGAVLNYRVAGTDNFIPVPPQAFVFNGYDDALLPAVINDNPLAGRQAFTGANEQSNAGSWGESIVDLSVLALQPGAAFQLQWTLGQDGCDGMLGWYVDDITIGFCGAPALPVTYLSFNAVAGKEHVDLLWETTREENNVGFHLERAYRGGFRDIAFLPAKATGRYTFRDERVSPGSTYVYRLRQLDAGGQENYSPLVSAILPEATRLRVFPNPAAVNFTVSGKGEEAVVYDTNGRLILRTPLIAGRGQVTGLARGVYLVRVGDQVQRIVIQ